MRLQLLQITAGYNCLNTPNYLLCFDFENRKQKIKVKMLSNGASSFFFDIFYLQKCKFLCHYTASWAASRKFSGYIPCYPSPLLSVPVTSGKDPPNFASLLF